MKILEIKFEYLPLQPIDKNYKILRYEKGYTSKKL